MRTLRSIKPLHFFSRSYLTEESFNHKMVLAGYPGAEGYCHGLSCYAAYSFITNQWKGFDDQLEKISKMPDSSIKLDANTIRFFDAVTFAQAPHEYTAFYKSPRSSRYQKQDTRSAMEYFALNDGLNISQSAHFSGIYREDELSTCFKLMQEANQTTPHNFALMIASLSHVITAHIDPVSSNWTITDSENLPTEAFKSNDCFAKAVSSALSRNSGNNVICIKVFTSSENNVLAEKFWATLQQTKEWKELHNAQLKGELFNKNNQNWLHMAAREGLHDEVVELLKSRVNVDLIYKNKTSQCNPLLLASQEGHFLIAKLLLDHDASPNLGNPAPLIYAVNNGDINMVNLLLTHGANLNLGAPTLLARAVINDDINMVNLLLSHGADPNKGVLSPIFYAENNPEMASLLIKHGSKAGSQLFFKPRQEQKEALSDVPVVDCRRG